MLHLSPRQFSHQTVHSSEIDTDPVPTSRTEGFDHFGNSVSRIFFDEPHASFDVTGESVVDVAFPAPPAPDETLNWEDVADYVVSNPGHLDVVEFLFPSPMIPADGSTHAYAQTSFRHGTPVMAGLLDLNHRIRQDFDYRAGTTTVGTPVARVMERREGVCQDFAHIMISCLRSIGLPARYVSGYLRTRPPAGKPLLRGADQSHAWVSAWLGPDHGWCDFDPTNDLVVQDEHVILAWGRDFGDVSPVRGVILGGGRHTLSVSVDLTTF
jgi:transglutaminase-like putative cysteine protease